jgi:hypothetical protein
VHHRAGASRRPSPETPKVFAGLGNVPNFIFHLIVNICQKTFAQSAEETEFANNGAVVHVVIGGGQTPVSVIDAARIVALLV